MTMVTSWEGTAYNQVPDSSNKIHGDEVAKQYGFKGGLVPGVTLAAYLTHPAIVAWGERWLRTGFAHVKVIAPVYHGDQFAVAIKYQQEESYTADLFSENSRCAEASILCTSDLPMAPRRQGQTIFTNDNPQPASREVMEFLAENGCPAARFTWHAQHEMAKYVEDNEKMPPLLRTESQDDTAGGKANLSFLLGCANRHFASVAHMSPWVHLESKSQNFQAVELNTNLISEMEVLDLFNKKGHEFADCEFNLYEEETGHCVSSIWQRAIYKMRGT